MAIMRSSRDVGFLCYVGGKAMKNKVVGIMATAVASATVGSIAVAQDDQGITVQASRAPTTEFHMSGGVPLVNMSLSYTVGSRDLDLTSRAGAAELEKRVHDAALAACKEIAKQLPDATPSVSECAKNAEGKAMVKVHELEAAADRKSAK
jgi:UrcA family protein